jgi:putative oxidoreductase
MAAFLRVVRDIVLLVARVALGAILVAHGWRRWQEQGIAAQTEYLRQFQTPYPEVAAYGAVVLEIVGGIFLLVGALTPLVALAVVAQQVLTIAYTNWYRGPYLTDSAGGFVGGYEYNVALAALAALLMVYGAGRTSVDALFRRAETEEDEAEPVASERPRVLV